MIAPDKDMMEVPYKEQIDENTCGAAALEMVYRFYGISNISQQEIFEKYKELEPHNTGNYRISTGDLVKDAKERGFNSAWIKVDISSAENALPILRVFINQLQIPVIVCQQFSEELPLIGHFRVVVGMENGEVICHDPKPDTGGEYVRFPIEKFVKYWQPTGNNVTGGVLVFVVK